MTPVFPGSLLSANRKRPHEAQPFKKSGEKQWKLPAFINGCIILRMRPIPERWKVLI
jgi:hypothetical protein